MRNERDSEINKDDERDLVDEFHFLKVDEAVDKVVVLLIDCSHPLGESIDQ